ncbi:LOW QUALITY PROTEIN: hypothetical protein OSB04_024282 [Centaurea solstitialis]|uniref:Reverse transcriptase domain-containing protein n=1 Tax=Centaurea solstitialis TaxID=347529 RepID=A0AA38SKT3_9ASTR|nr:LOW QUALITY PROTEIN: hypothetical protein OSB04_024282 [Centaurea solstitialis]
MEDDQPMSGEREKIHFTLRSAIKKTDNKNVDISEELIKMIWDHLTGTQSGILSIISKHLRIPVKPMFNCNLGRIKVRLSVKSLEKACERYKDLFLRLPNHGFEDEEVINIKTLVVEVLLAYRSAKEARKHLDDLVAHHLDWSTDEEESREEPEMTQVSTVTSDQGELQFKCERCEYNHQTKFCTWQQNPLMSRPRPEETQEQIERMLVQFMIGQGEIRKDANYVLRILKEAYPYVDTDSDDWAEVLVTTRAGKVVERPPMPETNQMPNLQVVEQEVELPSNQTEEMAKEVVRPSEPAPAPVNINVPLVDLIAGIPNYVKFIKELVSSKANLGILSNTPKKGDPGSFTIPCYFGKSVSCKALADIGASINLMPLSFYQRLGLGGLKNTRMTIQLADRSIKHRVGIAEDILVQVDKFLFPADFVILDINDVVNVPLILGQPFLNTANAIIHVAERQSEMKVGFAISSADEDILKEDPKEPEFEEIKQEDKVKVKTSLEEPRNLELKNLPEHLEYQFLEGKDSLPLIISSLLKPDEKEKLLEVLKKHQKALAWKISEIPGISPSFCTHKILMKDNFRQCVQKQKRLNPKMQEVMKKEVIRLRDTRSIYSISDSPWVSLVQVLPKKGGLTVITNGDNELVPTRTVTGWRLCIDYRKLNDATRKDHFPLPFIDEMLE